MGNSPVDRDKNYMREVWGTTSLTTDYGSTLDKMYQDNQKKGEKVLQEIMHDDLEGGKKHLKE